MKILAYIPCHYGSEYLSEAIKSIELCVDKIIILYTQKPSYGYGTEIECPETEWALKFIAQNASPKVEWKSYERFSHEGEHRNEIFKFAEGFDIVMTVDADEVWDTEVLKETLKEVAKTDSRYIQVKGWTHFWKSFNHACYDGFQPVRFHNLHSENKEQLAVEGKIYHFGYAQKEEIMDYKWEIHGHKSEIRKGWTYMYKNWQYGKDDVHPVSIGLWNPTPFDKTTLPEILKNHENYNKEVI